MGKNFDDLFNEFFKNDDSNEINKKLERLIKTLTTPFDVDSKKELEDALGEPDEVQNFENNGLFITKHIWHTENGDVIKMMVSSSPFENEFKKLSLEEQLEKALAEEDYETAAKLRDEIKNKDRKK
jgi:excinuclease UvrABC helicase subunit UvrB